MNFDCGKGRTTGSPLFGEVGRTAAEARALLDELLAVEEMQRRMFVLQMEYR